MIDGTPSHFFLATAFQRIHLAYGAQPMKLVVILRDPVDLAMIAYEVQVKHKISSLKKV
jgi:hypothetical protein